MNWEELLSAQPVRSPSVTQALQSLGFPPVDVTFLVTGAPLASNQDAPDPEGPAASRSSANALLFREFATSATRKKDRNVGPCRTLR
jgi:hypothetical protein